MKKLTFILSLVFSLSATISKAQLTAMDFYGMDCNGTMHNMFSELDAGKAVILHFYMPNCSSCPPPAQKIQTMANNILATHPNMITAYAFPYQNTTSCSYSSTWTSSNGLSLYSPMDSGAAQVAYYGGFGMPTVVLLGGTDHRVMFSTLSFATSDTTIMRDSILALFAPAGVSEQLLPTAIQSLTIYPNPASSESMIRLNLVEPTNLTIDVLDLTGRKMMGICREKNVQGEFKVPISTGDLSNGIYTIRITANDKSVIRKLNVVHQ